MKENAEFIVGTKQGGKECGQLKQQQQQNTQNQTIPASALGVLEKLTAETDGPSKLAFTLLLISLYVFPLLALPAW